MCTFMFISREWIVIPLLLVLHFCVYTNHSNLWGKCVPDYVEAMDPYCTSSWRIHWWNCVDSTSAIIWTQKNWLGLSKKSLRRGSRTPHSRNLVSSMTGGCTYPTYYQCWKWKRHKKNWLSLSKKLSKAGSQTLLSRSHVSSMTGGCTCPIYYRRVQVDNVENGTLLHQLA